MRKVLLTVLCLASVLHVVSLVEGSSPRDEFINALIAVESGGRDTAIGDRTYRSGASRPEKGWAYGPLQIRQVCLDDVNRRYGTHYQAKDLHGNRRLSVWVCRAYLGIYATRARLGRVPTEQDMARIWNGGPDGWKKPATQGYWEKVKQALP